ncbi:hypothetical protein [Roseovarius sp.]|uniref:hypothetical protein n=1 Tax=Roseovarius sp. TaxID=1486281 RepID=UPI003D0A7E1B
MGRRYLKWATHNGKRHYYHRRRGHPSYPVSAHVDIDDPAAVQKDFEDQRSGITWAAGTPSQVRRLIRLGVTKAKQRSVDRGMDFDLTTDEVLNLYHRQGGRCAVSGIKFSAEPAKNGRTNPFRPSLDRIDNNRGYTLDNVRIVLWGVNLARADFRDSEYVRICRGVAQNFKGTKLDNFRDE